MPDAARKRISDLLRRDDALIAREAARLFARHIHLLGESSPGAESRRDEAGAILADSFQRLCGVVALSLRVEEPLLVSEELQWLERSVGAQFETPPGTSPIDLLIDSFSGACHKLLSGDDCVMLDEVLVQARSGLAEIEPLLTEPRTRPHFEGITAQDN